MAEEPQGPPEGPVSGLHLKGGAPIQTHFLFRRGEAPSKLGNSSEKSQPQLSCPLPTPPPLLYSLYGPFLT